MTTYRLRDSTTGRYYPHEWHDRALAIICLEALEAAPENHCWEIETVTDENRDAEPPEEI